MNKPDEGNPMSQQTEHTPEPWTFAREEWLHDADVIRADGFYVAETRSLTIHGQPNDSHNPHDANRIVSCVNALAGLNPGAVRDALWAFQQIIQSLPHNPRSLQWLDPDVERTARAALAKLEEKQ